MKYRMKIENSRYMMASQVKKKETVKIKQSMTRTTGSFRAMTLRGKGAEQEEDVSGKMRQRSVMFLLDMLFGEHARRLPSSEAAICPHRGGWRRCIMRRRPIICRSRAPRSRRRDRW